MDHPELNDRLREPLDEEERMLMDPDSWEETSPGEIEISPKFGIVLSLRFSRDEFQRLSRLARKQGMFTTDFVKHAALAYESSPEIPASATRHG